MSSSNSTGGRAAGSRASGSRPSGGRAAGSRAAKSKKSVDSAPVSSASPSLHVVIAGGSGMIGRAITAALFAAGHNVTVLTRSVKESRQLARARVVTWAPDAQHIDLDALGVVDVIINLAGTSLSRMPWTAKRKLDIVKSRIDATEVLVDAVARAAVKPRVFINASAVGIYGDRGDEALPDYASEGTGFLADVVREWEGVASTVDPAVRLVLARLGVVIGPEGAMTPLRKLARFSLAGPMGNGRQWWPWVSLHDVVRAFIHFIENRAMSGPVNVVGPTPATQRDVVRAIARRLHRASWFPTPKFVLRARLGEAANEMLLASQKVVPTHLVANGFQFEDPTIDRAVARALLAVDRQR